MKKKHEIPKGLDHLDLMIDFSSVTQKLSATQLGKKHSHELEIIGTSLCSLYQAATCYRKCHGGPHILEALMGRTYNLGCAAYLLIENGFYDEALSLIRNIGEIANLIMLSIVDKKGIREWISCDRETRLKKFGPANVRRMIEKQNGLLMMDRDLYAELCEKYTHVTPGTKPNLHNAKDRPMAGGVFQESGIEIATGELTTILYGVSLAVCRYFQFNDLFDELAGLIDEDKHDVQSP